MQRVNRRCADRGAVAVWVAIMMMPLMIVGALAIDVAAMHADRQRLQTGADAAALAIAQDCAAGACGDTDATAQELAAANNPLGGPAAGIVTEINPTAGRVEVRTSSERDHWFAPVIGQNDVMLAAASAAAWGYPTGGAHMPLAFSYCEIVHLTGATPIMSGSSVVGLNIPERTEVTLFNKGSESDFHGCLHSNGQALPGGFGWLDPEGACLGTTTLAGGWAGSNTGNNPGSCSTTDFRSIIGQTILLPVFDQTRGTGNTGEYHILGYLAFTLDSFYFSGQFDMGYTLAPGYPGGPVADPCGGNGRCIHGTIERFVDLDSAFEMSPGGPQLGAAIVALQLPGGQP